MSGDDALFSGPPPSSFERAVAAAVEGDEAALAVVLADDRLDDWVGRHRMGAALFVAARAAGIEGPAVDGCRAICMATAVQWMRLRAALSGVGSALDAADIRWLPLKGLDTAERFFPRPELRLSSDIDLLVPGEQVDEARQVLEAAGCTFPSTPRLAAYQRAEGYNWHGQGPEGASLELHYRLWGMVPDSVIEECWSSAVPARDLGRRGFRLAPAMAFLVSAVHSWIHLGRPQFIYWWEMKLIADRIGSPSEVAVLAREHGLQFPVGLAAEYVGRLWDHEFCLALGRVLLDEIRLPERLALGRVRRRGIDAMTLELLYVSRLLARRPSRMGMRSVFRRVWPHPGIVESTTPAGLAWWRRRAAATRRNLGGAG